MEDTNQVDLSTSYKMTRGGLAIKVNILPFETKPNFELRFNGMKSPILMSTRLEKTLKNRIKYWFLCRLFSFKVINWETGTN